MHGDLKLSCCKPSYCIYNDILVISSFGPPNFGSFIDNVGW